MSATTSADMLAPIDLAPVEPSLRAQTERDASETILDSPAYWYRLAEEDQRNNPDLVAEYRRMAALMERYIELRRGGQP